jgi:hypothetical protein
MLNIYEKAREFKEKYRISSEFDANATSEKFYTNSDFEKQLEEYSRVVASLKSEILVLQSELEIIESAVDEFLIKYYEKFSNVLLEKNVYSTKENPIRSNFNDEVDSGISLIENRGEAFKKELKNVYRKLAKLCHPDKASGQFPALYFQYINDLYKQSALDELLYLEAQIESQGRFHNENIIIKIERLEFSIESLKAKLSRLEDRKSILLSSAEYKLFLKYKLSEIRGYDFFDSLFSKLEL